MAVTVLWLAVLGVGVGWEAYCHLAGRASSSSPSGPDRRWATLTSLAARLWARPAGRVALILAWAFVGFHIFARYTVPA